MTVVNKLVNSTLYIGIKGELDESTANDVRNKLDILIDKNKMTRIVLDLSELSFMDSTGIGVLIGRYKRLKSLNIPVFLAGANTSVDKVLKLSGIYGVMPKIEF